MNLLTKDFDTLEKSLDWLAMVSAKPNQHVTISITEMDRYPSRIGFQKALKQAARLWRHREADVLEAFKARHAADHQRLDALIPK